MFPAPLVVPGTPSVTFPIMRGQFTATWNEPTLYVNETVDAYFVNISGPNDLCGNNSNNMAQRVTERSYTCSMQTTPQEGDTYTIRVAAASCDGNLRGPESLPATLQGISKSESRYNCTLIHHVTVVKICTQYLVYIWCLHIIPVRCEAIGRNFDCGCRFLQDTYNGANIIWTRYL